MYKFQDFVDGYPRQHRAIAQRTVEFFETRGIDCLLTDEKYDFFCTKNTISKTQFYALKNALISFVEYVKVPNEQQLKNSVEKISQTEVAKRIDVKLSLYKDLDDVLATIEKIVKDRGLHKSDATPLQSVAILIWFGYSNEQIINFLVDDIAKMKIAQKYKAILSMYAELRYYRALPSGKVQNILNSKYLFRTANTEQLTDFDLKKIISKINSMVSSINKGFSRAIITKSSRFKLISEVYNDKTVTHEAIRQYFGQGIKRAEVEKTIIEYQKWYNEE